MEASISLFPIALVLFLSYAGGALFHRLRQPVVIGYMLVGALLGPTLFQGSESMISWLAELAIIILMFMLGLELDIGRFKASMKPALMVTSLQIALSLFIMSVLSIYFGWSWQLGILLGFVAALSSTAVAVSMLDSLHETDSNCGSLAVAILVAQDLAVVPMLLVVGVLSSGTISAANIFHGGVSISIIILTLVGIFELHSHPRWVSKIERIFMANASQPAVAGLALAFGAAAFSGWLGLSNAYGAFAVGLLVGNIGTMGASYRRAVHSIHDLLMMTFFLSIGLLLDVPFILRHPFEILIVLACTLLLKTAVNFVILNRFLGVSKRSSLTLASVLGQIGEFSFVLIALGIVVNMWLGNEL
jgi:CPA2 family monovalent cation:H+ antiporter-2